MGFILLRVGLMLLLFAYAALFFTVSMLEKNTIHSTEFHTNSP